MEQAIDETDVINYKNGRLIPMYSELTSLIRFYKTDETAKVTREFEFTKGKLDAREDLSAEAKAMLLEKLKTSYSHLVAKIEGEKSKPKSQLTFLRDKLILLYNILKQWEA